MSYHRFLIPAFVGLAALNYYYHYKNLPTVKAEQAIEDTLSSQSEGMKSKVPVQQTSVKIQLSERRDADTGRIPEVSWDLIQKCHQKADSNPPVIEFPAELKALDGQKISVVGAVFFPKPGIQNGKVVWSVLMPPRLISCCGLNCAPSIDKIMVLDHSTQPLPLPDRRGLARATGRLKLETDGSMLGFCTLEDATFTLSPAP